MEKNKRINVSKCKKHKQLFKAFFSCHSITGLVLGPSLFKLGFYLILGRLGDDLRTYLVR